MHYGGKHLIGLRIGMKRVGRTISGWLALYLMTACASLAPNSSLLLPEFTTETNGRDFRGLSIFPNSEDWLFTECARDLNPEGDCYLLKYSLNSKQLQRYVLPAGYLYGNANISPSGSHIIFDRVPKHDGSDEMMNHSFDSGQILMMRTDGTDFSVLPISKGRILGPVMSRDEARIAYWRRTSAKGERHARHWSDGDVWEFQLRTGQDQLFAGPFHFFDGIISQYVSNDEVLLQTYATQSTVQISDYRKMFNGSEVYKLRRGSTEFPAPSFIDIQNASSPSVDKEGNIYLSGQQLPKFGSAFFRKSPSGETDHWIQPIFQPAGEINVVAPNGQYVAFMYVADGTSYADKKRAFGVLNLGTSEWQQVAIPPLQSSTPVIVRTALE